MRPSFAQCLPSETLYLFNVKDFTTIKGRVKYRTLTSTGIRFKVDFNSNPNLCVWPNKLIDIDIPISHCNKYLRFISDKHLLTVHEPMPIRFILTL